MPQAALAFAAPIAGGLISRAIAERGSDFSGGGARFQPISLKTPNFKISGQSFEDATIGFNIRRTGPLLDPQRKGLFDLLGRELASVKPGFGRLTTAVRDAFAAARGEALGDIRESFAKRRLAGSSFAVNQIGSIKAEFALKESQALAQAGISEIAQRVEIIRQQNILLANAAQESLEELRIGASFVTNITSGLNELAGINAKLEFDANVGAGKAAARFGDIFGVATEGFLGSKGFSDFLGLDGNSAATGPGSTGFQTAIGQAGFNFGL